jgi:uncharacterized protein
MIIIDSHCHAGKGDGLTGPWDTYAPLKNYLKWANEYNITKTVLFATFHSDYAKANFEVARIVGSNPQRFFGFAFVHAIRAAGKIFSMIQTATAKYRFCGIKVHRYDARITREICETARSLSLPVLYDIMGEVSQVYLLANEYPDVNFIIPHIGSFADDWKAQQSFIDPLSRYPNIYTDSAGVRRFELLKEALDRAGAHKILFGSDGPWLHPGVELEKIYALRSSEQDLELMLAGNYLRLIRKIKLAQNQIEPSGTKLFNTHNLHAETLENRDPWLFRQLYDVS